VVAPGVFWSTIVVVISFLPVFLLTGMEGKLFHPLAFTKTFILLVDAFLSITLTPVLISFFLRGKLRSERKNPVTRILEKIYTPILTFCLKRRTLVIIFSLLLLAAAVPMLLKTGSEFMPPLDEGSILFMPTTMPDISNSEAKQLLQLQDKIIMSMPEVEHVLGKAGRAYTATDNSPISMFEIIILLKPKSAWRAGKTKEDIINELNSKLQIPGVVNGFTQPIINRINMLSTGIRTDVGLKLYGQNLDTIYKFAQMMEKELENVNGVKDLYVEPITGGKYIDVAVKRDEIGRYGLSVDDVNMIVESALGGINLTTTIEGRQRFKVNVRFAQDFRNDINQLKRLAVQTKQYGTIPLSAVADISLNDGPAMINTENAMLRGTVLFDVRGRDMGSTVNDAKKKLEVMVGHLPKGYYLAWSGQYEDKLRSDRTLKMIMPVVLLLIFFVLYFTYDSFKEAFIIIITIPFALIGGVFMVFFYKVNFSVGVAVGFIALFGVAIKTAMILTIYLNEAMHNLVAKKGNSRETITKADIREYVMQGTTKRLRPIIMTVSVSLFGLIPILWAKGVGTDVMLPIAIPLIGGVITSTFYVLLVTPVIFEITKEMELKRNGHLTLVGVKKEISNEK
jgi:Cu(I)/Ag(I) efflux system membrane protein CusA/SilA